MKIADWFIGKESGAVLADSSVGQIVRLFAVVPLKGATGKAVRRFFPDAQALGNTGVVRLGGWRDFPAAGRDLAEAKMVSTSPTLQSLHLVEGREGVGMATIPHNLLVGRQFFQAPSIRGRREEADRAIISASSHSSVRNTVVA